MFESRRSSRHHTFCSRGQTDRSRPDNLGHASSNVARETNAAHKGCSQFDLSKRPTIASPSSIPGTLPVDPRPPKSGGRSSPFRLLTIRDRAEVRWRFRCTVHEVQSAGLSTGAHLSDATSFDGEIDASAEPHLHWTHLMNFHCLLCRCSTQKWRRSISKWESPADRCYSQSCFRWKRHFHRVYCFHGVYRPSRPHRSRWMRNWERSSIQRR